MPRKKLIEKFKDKTIYFLGAGFPMSAGAPSQSDLMERLKGFDPSVYAGDYRHLNGDIENILGVKLSRVREFIDSLLINNYDADLEDIYTPIDRCIMDDRSFGNFSPQQLVEIREDLNSLIAFIIDRSFRVPGGDSHYIRDFAKYIVDSNQKARKERSVIFTTNWDIALDQFIYHTDNGAERYYNVIDYCCQYTNFEGEPPMIPALVAHERKIPSNKILKLHGSYNWLTCSNCGKVQVGIDQEIVLKRYTNEANCRFCDSSHLQSSVLMPTFLKSNNTTQLKNIWEQAGIELSEAKKIVFMGYSFPMADFEIKQLFSRFVRPETKIEVVLTSSSDPKFYKSITDKDDKKLEKIKKSIWSNLPTHRYNRFFSKNEIKFHFGGVEKYIKEEL